MDMFNKIIVIASVSFGVIGILLTIYEGRRSRLRMMEFSVKKEIRFSNFYTIISNVIITSSVLKKVVYVKIYINTSKAVMSSLLGEPSLDGLKQHLNYFVKNPEFKYEIEYIEE
jgi:hypothetical protein